MKICIVAHNAYGAMNNCVYGGHVGGVERQTSMLCCFLAGRGHEVILLTWDEGQPNELVLSGVKIIKMCPSDAGLPGFRFFHPRWSSLCSALEKADADLYYHNCAECVTGQVAIWCRIHKRRFVYSVASEPACIASLPEMRSSRDRFFYRFGIRNADRIIVQTQKQRSMLIDGFKLNSIVLPMPCPGPSESEYNPPPIPSQNTKRVIWVGRTAKVKRLELLLDVAEQLPEILFDVVGKPNMDTAYSHAVLGRAAKISNVILHGHVPWDQMKYIYQRASVLCCTSLYEGFPNTFIEAWSHGIPVISTFDPDGIIEENNLGIAAYDLPTLVMGIKTLNDSPERWRVASKNSRQYYVKNHTLDIAMDRFERLFIGLINEKR